MRKKYSAMIITLCLLLTGCNAKFLPYSREIDEYELITTLGVDKIGDDFALATASLRDREPFILTNKAKTIAVAFKEMQTFSDKLLYLGHAHYYLLGENAVKEDLDSCLDFLVRDPNLRMDSKIYVVKDADAQSVIEQSGDIFITDRLMSLEKDIELLSEAKPVPMIELLQQRRQSFLIPTVFLVDKGLHNVSEAGKTDMDVGGYAVFKKDRLVGFLDGEGAKAVCQLTGNAFMDTIEVKLPDGGYAALVIIHPEPVLSVSWDGAVPSALNVRFRFSTSLLESHNKKDLSNDTDRETLVRAQEELIYRRLENAVSRAQQLGTDYFGFSAAAKRDNAGKFETLSGEWDEIFSKLPVNIEIESSIEREY